MPLQINITQPSGAVATYHVVMNVTGNNANPGNAAVTINSYLSQAAYAAGDAPLGSMNQMDISPLVNNPTVAAPSIWAVIEGYLLTTPTFSGATQVS